MDRTLTADDVDWLRRMRDANSAKQSVLGIPLHITLRLKMQGYIAANGPGEYVITLRGRDELLDRERQKALH